MGGGKAPAAVTAVTTPLRRPRMERGHLKLPADQE